MPSPSDAPPAAPDLDPEPLSEREAHRLRHDLDPLFIKAGVPLPPPSPPPGAAAEVPPEQAALFPPEPPLRRSSDEAYAESTPPPDDPYDGLRPDDLDEAAGPPPPAWFEGAPLVTDDGLGGLWLRSPTGVLIGRLRADLADDYLADLERIRDRREGRVAGLRREFVVGPWRVQIAQQVGEPDPLSQYAVEREGYQVDRDGFLVRVTFGDRITDAARHLALATTALRVVDWSVGSTLEQTFSALGARPAMHDVRVIYAMHLLFALVASGAWRGVDARGLGAPDGESAPGWFAAGAWRSGGGQ